MNSDPFEILGIEPTMHLDLEKLNQIYLSKAARCHPDLALSLNQAVDPDELTKEAARLNDAHQTLANLESRASALLARLGGDLAKDDKSLPQDLLMEMMEVRQHAQIAQENNDEQELDKWRAWAGAERDEYINKVTRAFDEVQAEPKPDSLREIRQLLNAWRYIERMIDQLSPGYDPLADTERS